MDVVRDQLWVDRLNLCFEANALSRLGCFGLTAVR